VIDLTKEKLIGLAAAAQVLPASRLGRPVTESCVLRWIQKGVRLPSGERVRLEAIRLGAAGSRRCPPWSASRPGRLRSLARRQRRSRALWMSAGGPVKRQRGGLRRWAFNGIASVAARGPGGVGTPTAKAGGPWP
jgi:hypothetical protein